MATSSGTVGIDAMGQTQELGNSFKFRGVQVPPPLPLGTKDWFTWTPAYDQCVFNQTTSAAVCGCQKVTQLAARVGGLVVPLTVANAAAYKTYMGKVVTVVHAPVSFNHTLGQQEGVTRFAADTVAHGCGNVHASSDCMASGQFLPNAVDPELGTCTCIPAAFLNGLMKPAGARCSLLGATNANAIALFEGMGYYQFGPDGLSIDSVGDFGMPRHFDGKSVPGSQVACQNSQSIIAGACPYSPGRTVCAPNVGGQKCDAVLPTVAPPGNNSIWNVTEDGLGVACPKNAPLSVWDPSVKACVRDEEPSLWCNSRGYIRGQSQTSVPICACLPGYSGNACQFILGCPTACDAVNQFCNIASPTGPACECLPGYYSAGAGKPCSGYDPKSNATCTVTCLKGSCATPTQCTCDPGWQGQDCSTPVCPANCNSVGECAVSSAGVPECICPARFPRPSMTCTGAEYALAGPCMNGGSVDSAGFRCTCVGGFTGWTCDSLPHCDVCCPPDRCSCLASPTTATCRAPWHVSGYAFCCNYYHCLDGEALVVDAHGELVRVADLRKGSTALTLLESSASLAVEVVSGVDQTAHHVSRVAAVCRGATAAEVSQALATDKNAPVCTVVSYGHGLGVQADARLLKGVRIAKAVRAAVLAAVPNVAADGTPAAAALTNAFLPMADVVALLERASPQPVRGTSAGPRVMQLSSAGLRSIDATGAVDSTTVVVWGFTSVSQLPLHMARWSDDSTSTVQLFSYVVPSGRQTIVAATAAAPASAEDLNEARVTLGLTALQTLCMPHSGDGIAPRVAPEVLVALARRLTTATTNCTTTDGSALALSTLIDGLVAQEDAARRYAAPGFTALPPIKEGSPAVNDATALAAASASSLVADFLTPCDLAVGGDAAPL